MAYYSTSTLVPAAAGPLFAVFGPGDLIAGEPAESEELARVWVERLAAREAEIQAALDAGDTDRAQAIWEEVEEEARSVVATRVPQTLDELYEVLKAAPRETNTGAQADYGLAHGLPVAHGEIDWTSLPTFGGEEPANTSEVWSWDATRLLIGTCQDDLEIVERPGVSAE